MRDTWWMVAWTLTVVFCAGGSAATLHAAAPGASAPGNSPAQTRPDDARKLKTAAEIRQLKVAELIADAHKLYDATQFREAADLLHQATIIDPQNETAQLFLRLVMTKIMNRDFDLQQQRLGTQPANPRDNVAKALDQAPSPFGPITISAFTGFPKEPPESRANRAMRDRLEENLKEITADNQGLEKVLNFLRDNMGANIFVNWAALNNAGIERTAPVTVSLKEVPFRKALTTILSQVSTGTAQLAYTIDDGIITISTKEDLSAAKYQSIREYDIRGLLPPPEPTPATQTRTASQPATVPADATRKQAIDALIKSIKTTVAPDSWRDQGGTIGSITELNGILTVNQTHDNQVATYNLLRHLADMEKTQVLQVAMESRILLVSNDFLDNFRFGWNGTMSSIIPPALSFSILDDGAINFLPTAAQSDKRTIVVAPPRMIAGNGLEARLFSTPGQRYIASYAVNKLGNITQYVPLLGATGPAISLTITPTASEDRRTINMRLTLMIQRLTRIDHAPAPDTPPEMGLQIDKPVLAATSHETAVTVRDGGAILLSGGQVAADSLQLQGDLYKPQESVQVLILLRPNLIMHREIENDLFGK